jgi:hypothetical protein
LASLQAVVFALDHSSNGHKAIRRAFAKRTPAPGSDDKRLLAIDVVEFDIWRPANIAMISGYNPHLRTNQVFTSCVSTA